MNPVKKALFYFFLLFTSAGLLVGCGPDVEITETDSVFDKDVETQKAQYLENLKNAKNEMGKAINLGFLGNLGPDAADAIPEIEKIANDPNEDPKVRRIAIRTIAKIKGEDPDAAVAGSDVAEGEE